MIKDALEANGLRVSNMDNGYLFVTKEREHASHTMAPARQMTKAFDEVMEKIYNVAKCGNQMKVYVDHSPEQMWVCQKLRAIGFEIEITNTGFWILWE